MPPFSVPCLVDSLQHILKTDNMLSTKSALSTACILLAASLAVAAPLLRETCFTAIDVETTGLSPSRDRVIELTAIRFQGSNSIWSSTWLFNPGTNIPSRSTSVHGITDRMVKDQPTFSTVAADISAALTNSIIIAHNARFDWSFMSKEFARAGAEVPHVTVVDSIPWSKLVLPARRSYSLHALSADLNLHTAPTHRSESDTMALVELIQHCIGSMETNATLDKLEDFALPAKNQPK